MPESFSGPYGTTEVVPLPRIVLYGSVASHPFSQRTRKKDGAPRLVGTMCRTEIYGTRLMASAERNMRSRGFSDDAKRGRARFVLCVRNEGYPAGLESRKVYRVLADGQGSKRHLLRVIDESGEDYLYPEEYFVFVG